VLAAQWQAHHHRPAFYVALDRRRRCCVVSVRGTLQLGDFCTVLDAKPTAATLGGVDGHVHAGFLAAARSLLPAVAAALHAAAGACPGWPVLITGHSLGGGVAAVLALLLRDAGGRLGEHDWRRLGESRCVGVGAAAALCRQLGGACTGHVTSLLYGCAHCAASPACSCMCRGWAPGLLPAPLAPLPPLQHPAHSSPWTPPPLQRRLPAHVQRPGCTPAHL
jgi:hypothetical protein